MKIPRFARSRLVINEDYTHLRLVQKRHLALCMHSNLMPLQTLTPALARQIAADYPALQSLSLASNALKDVCHLQLLPRSLTQLDLGGNRLAALPDELGTWLPELKLLRLRANALEKLHALAGCTRLQTLDLGDNRVVRIDELRFLQPLKQLRHLSLDGNPVADAATYRHEVLGLLPQLQSLDGQEITGAERLYAKLQLKTQTGGPTSSTPSPAPSPTRLLTPESIRTQRDNKVMPPVMTTLSVNGEEVKEKEGDREKKSRWEEGDFGHDRVEFHASSATETQPPPLALPSTGPPLSIQPSKHASERLNRRLDHWDDMSFRYERNDSNPTRESAGSHNRAGSRLNGDNTDDGMEPGTKEVLLKSRVQALESILAVHDNTMRNALARFGQQNARSQLSVAVKIEGGAIPTVEAAAAVYTRLLTAWREKCVALMVQAHANELANEAFIHGYREQEARIREGLAHCEEEMEMWRQRAADFEAQRDLEVVATRQAEDRRAQANAKAVQAVRGLALEREKLQRLAETVVRFTGGLVRGKVEQLHSGSTRLEALEQRLSLAKERVELAATLVTHREARLRNSEAALEAERRVWTNRLEQMRSRSLQGRKEGGENGGDASNEMTLPLPGGKILRPATETALRALFHRLDSYDTGLVRSQVLLQALRRADPGVLSAVGGPKKLSKLASHVETAIHKLSVAGRAIETLTWGEFLLFFIPDSSVSLAELLRDTDGSGDATEGTLERASGACALCAAVKTNGMPSWPFTSPSSAGEPTDQTLAETMRTKRRKERKLLETLSHAELVQQNAVLLADRGRLRRLVARDAHDLQDRVRGVRREWEAKTGGLIHEKDLLQRALDEQTKALDDTRQQREASEAAHDEASLEVQRLREQLSAQEREFELAKKKLEAGSVERLQHEQEVWQTEVQDVRLAHSLLQADHGKQQVRIRQLERDLARQKEALLAHETERVASLEEKVRRRDAELARLRRERNSLLTSLREHEQKLAAASAVAEPPATESSAAQTDEVPRVKQKTAACQTTPPSLPDAGCDVHGGRMSINEISTPNSLAEERKSGGDDSVGPQGVKPPPRLTPEDVTRRLQKLQSLTESLLAD
jgi:hypothetical protein